VLIQLFPPDDERLSLETRRGGKINTLKKVKKCVKLVENPQFPQNARSTEYKKRDDICGEETFARRKYPTG
jgi:hypothetical protein